MFALERSGNIPEIVKYVTAEAGCEIRTIPLVAWNAAKTYYDNHFYHGGNIPVSLETTQVNFRIYALPVNTREGTRHANQLFQWLKETMASMN